RARHQPPPPVGARARARCGTRAGGRSGARAARRALVAVRSRCTHRRPAALDYRRGEVAGGAKLTWELGRLTLLPTLALAARLTGERAFADRALSWLA